jgi:hypothetical protein
VGHMTTGARPRWSTALRWFGLATIGVLLPLTPTAASAAHAPQGTAAPTATLPPQGSITRVRPASEATAQESWIGDTPPRSWPHGPVEAATSSVAIEAGSVRTVSFRMTLPEQDLMRLPHRFGAVKPGGSRTYPYCMDIRFPGIPQQMVTQSLTIEPSAFVGLDDDSLCSYPSPVKPQQCQADRWLSRETLHFRTGHTVEAGNTCRVTIGVARNRATAEHRGRVRARFEVQCYTSREGPVCGHANVRRLGASQAVFAHVLITSRDICYAPTPRSRYATSCPARS